MNQSYRVRTPIALIVFNRPDLTARLLERLAPAEPPELFVIADGPRPMVPEDIARCASVRSLIDGISWCPRVHRCYAERNMGCRHRLATGITEVFERVEEAIVLEDDCLPHPTFLRFCDELLDRFRNTRHVMSITGANFQYGWPCDASYFPTRFAHVWGWASWRRAWKLYDVAMRDWPQQREHPSALLDLDVPGYRDYWMRIFDMVHAGQIDTWDFQWTYAHMRHGGVSIAPHVNMVENTGFGAGATHTARVPQWLRQPSAAMSFPLQHGPVEAADDLRDARTFHCGNLLRPPKTPVRMPRWLDSIHKKLPGWRWRHDLAMRALLPMVRLGQKRTRPAFPRGGSPV